MEIKITTNQTLLALQVVSWIIFIGLCIETGGIIVNTIITLFINPAGVYNYWEGSGYLSNLYSYDIGYFAVITGTMSIVAILKSFMFYLIVKLFTDKTLNMERPFSMELRGFILNLVYLSVGISIFSHVGSKYTLSLADQGLGVANLEALHLEGADLWLFMAIILVVIAQIIKRGFEIQTENDLTISLCP
jgi:hypothetical protein